MRSVDLEKTPRLPLTANCDSKLRTEGATRNRWAAAYHEAGHAVFAYEVGWWVNYEGIDIDQQFTGLGCREIDYTPWRRAWVHLAGPMAEYRFLGLDPSPDPERLMHGLVEVRHGRHRAGDEGEVLRALADQFPDESDEIVLKEYQAFAAQVWHEISCDARRWGCIEAIASALIRNSTLTADDVELLLTV